MKISVDNLCVCAEDAIMALQPVPMPRNTIGRNNLRIISIKRII